MMREKGRSVPPGEGDMDATTKSEEEERIWEEIERAESYMLSSMYEEAASLASSIMRESVDRQVLECGGMVLLQSLHNLHPTSDLLTQLSSSIQQLKLIPIQLLLTGACLQMSSSPNGPCAVAEFLEEFLKGHYDVEGDDGLVEFYCVDVLANALGDTPRAISCLRNSTHLPPHVAERLLTRLQSLQQPVPVKATPPKATSSCEVSDKQQALLRLSNRVEPCIWWYRTLLTFKFAHTQLAVSNGNLVLACLAVLLCWILRRKQLSFKGMVKRQALNAKKAVVELWQLAFSHQVSPLAAVQSPIRASHR